MFQGHINVLKVSSNGYLMYLAKYIGKPEKSDPVVIIDKTKSNVERYLQSRVCSEIEASALLLSKPHVHSSRKFVHCTTDPNAKRILRRKKDMPKEKDSKFLKAIVLV